MLDRLEKLAKLSEIERSIDHRIASKSQREVEALEIVPTTPSSGARNMWGPIAVFIG